MGGLVAAVAVAAAVVVSAADDASPPVDVQLLALNDFHGNLEPPAGSGGRITQPDGTNVEPAVSSTSPRTSSSCARATRRTR